MGRCALRDQVGSRRAELRLFLMAIAKSHHPFCGLTSSFNRGMCRAMSEPAMLRGCRAKVCEAPGIGLELFECPCSACLFLIIAEPRAHTDTLKTHSQSCPLPYGQSVPHPVFQEK